MTAQSSKLFSVCRNMISISFDEDGSCNLEDVNTPCILYYLERRSIRRGDVVHFESVGFAGNSGRFIYNGEKLENFEKNIPLFVPISYSTFPVGYWKNALQGPYGIYLILSEEECICICKDIHWGGNTRGKVYHNGQKISIGVLIPECKIDENYLMSRDSLVLDGMMKQKYVVVPNYSREDLLTLNIVVTLEQ